MRLSQVRTLAFFGVFKCMASIVEFRLLQVLILHFWGDEESISFDLTRISELFRLRYLQVTCNVTLELRTQMRGLQYLETLKIDARVSAIPSDIVHLPGLLHLNLPAETNLPNGIGHMTSLRTLGYFDLGCNSIENVQSLGELTNLRDLQLTCYNIQPDNLKNMQCLGSILGKLSSLKSITLVPAGSSNVNTLDVAGATSMSISGDGLSSVSSPLFLLQRLQLSPRVCIFSSLPKWIGHLCKLCILKIGVRELARTIVDVLRGLPALTVLSLYVHTKPAERIVFDKVGFSVLKYFKFRCSVAWLKFGAGAMPNLRKLKLGFNAHTVNRHSTTIPVGIEHLLGLKEISAKIGGASAEEPDGRSAESALSDAIRMHPGRPNVNIQCVDRMFGGKDDESSGTQEEEHMALQKQYEIMEENEVQEPEPMLPAFLFPFTSLESSQSQVTISDSIQRSSAHKKRKALPEQSTRVRVSAGQDEGPPDDGFSWRKYGPKDIPATSTQELKKVESKPAIVMADALVSASKGAMDTLLMKLTALTPKLIGMRRKEVMILKDELGTMNVLLEKLADMAELNFQMKDWRNQMREMTYDIEDCIDDIMLQFDEDNVKPYHIHQLATAYPEKWDVLQKFILQIQSLMGKGDLGSMVHKTEVQILGSSYMATESRLPAVYDKAIGLVGMDGPRDELVRWLMDGEQQHKVVCILGRGGLGKTTLAKEVYGEQKHKVVCILGRGGLGKTTLAKEVYNKIKGQFCCRVFVPVPQKIDITRLLRYILSQLNHRGKLYGQGMEELSNEIIRCLQDKRYLIVLDGVWSAQTWKYIQHALPENNRASRIIITTNIRDVAESCVSHSSGFIYHMRPLRPDDSCRLFRSIIFGSERSCPIALEKVGDKVLEACGGIPLAIIIIASFLANKPTEVAQWETVEKRMDPAEKGALTIEGMKKIFHICYSDLPRHMKSCLLYLSVFPGNHVIRKDRVIWRWIAEGFIPRRGEESLWETGESYFQELICRKLIEPTYDGEKDDDVPTSCKVHGVILEFVTSLSSEENFVTTDPKTTYMRDGVIRRLTVNYSNQEEDGAFWPITEELSKVRSLTFFGDVKRMPGETLHCLRFLRVLDLEDTENLWNHHLRGIERLVLLRYLGLGGTGIYTLPEEIGELQHLETLDLRRTTQLRTLPASIVGLRKLVRLLLDRRVELPREIWKVEKLEELSTILVHTSSSLDSVVELLIKSKQLRMLGVRWDEYFTPDRETTETFQRSVRSFLKEVGKSNLQSLLLEVGATRSLLNILLDSWVPPHHLRRFELTISILGRVPPKLASLVNLTHLRISIDEVEAEGLRVLGDLPNLILLKLESRLHAERRLINSRHGFRCLVVFSYTCKDVGMGLQFTRGAIPQLRRLRIEFSAWKTVRRYQDFDFGIQHLSCLTRVHAAIHCQNARKQVFPYCRNVAEAVEAAEAAIREQVSKNPNSPVLELSRGSTFTLQCVLVNSNCASL